MNLERGQFYTHDHIQYVDFKSMPTVYTTKFNPETKKAERTYVYNVPASADTETTSFRDHMDRKVALVYIYQLNIDGYCFYARTTEDWLEMMRQVVKLAGLGPRMKMYIYFHNLSFDFSFIKKDFEFEKVFSNGAERKVLTASTVNGIEFRCSQMLSGQSLANVAKDLIHYKIDKMVGDLDYDVLRHPLTPLTYKEMQYNLNDIIIVEYYLREAMLKAGGKITSLPLTSTGYVRNHTRERTLFHEDGKLNQNYANLMKELTLGVEEYQMLRQAFTGGSVQAQVQSVGHTVENVKGEDLASSYPAVAVMQQFPMGKGEYYDCVDMDDAVKQMQNYCCLFYVEFTGLMQVANIPYIPSARLLDIENAVYNNGKVVSATRLGYICTEVDYATLAMVYEWDEVKVGRMIRYKRGYLPTELVKVILDLYGNKTRFKGVKEKKVEYDSSKVMVNSAYGMMVQDIVQDDYVWDDQSKDHTRIRSDKDTIVNKNGEEVLLIEDKIERYNTSKKRFLSYAWGVWITAHARHQLFRATLQLREDFRYGDTDSVKYINQDIHKPMFASENARVQDLINRAAMFHNMDPSQWAPNDPDGRSRMIGIWDDDGFYLRFKSLGAKRYMIEQDVFDKKTGKTERVITLTVAGVNKKTAVPYLQETYGDDIFDAFNTELRIPEGACGKKTKQYIDEYRTGTLIDVHGTPFTYHVQSGIHLEETSYQMSIASDFADYIEYMQGQSR